ncbi:MAG: succinyldiaminopimelate transaminase [Porticoccaceae bacterium]|nr:succinyldiaminopimelate transaminase [Porticoccaceae bacterium]
MNPDLQHLQPYPFEKLRALKSGLSPAQGLNHIDLSVGEPKHPAPEFVRQTLVDQLSGLSLYPATKGIPELREAIAQWLGTRFKLSSDLNPETQVLPVNGTREALFAFAQTVINPGDPKQGTQAVVLMPNPFYQIYEGAALLAGAEPVFANCSAKTNFQPDFASIPEAIWRRCQLVYLCSPGNPTGAVLDLDNLKQLIELGDRYDFIIASDECYSEIYGNKSQPPPGLLQACTELGRNNYQRCVVFHSLSKRSNLPGLRSGFVAGDADVLKHFLLYRTYHGSAMPVQHQHASIAAWGDEVHVEENRTLYREKFKVVTDILRPIMNVPEPDAGFYLWPETPIPDTDFTRELYRQQHVSVVPGSYLARDTATGNPGAKRIRMALVAPLEQCQQAAERIKALIKNL